MFEDLPVIICSYKATKEFKLCLHQLGKFGLTNLLIYENSPEDYTDNRKMLDEYKIPYINNPGGDHAHTMNFALANCRTKYALLLDSDCIILRKIARYFQYVKDHNITLYGDICGDRGGLHIHKRVHPWFCFVDVDFLKEHYIEFVDFARIKASHSESFVDCKRLSAPREQFGFYYDAGSSMFEDVIANDGLVADIGYDSRTPLDIPYYHKEGSSWRPDDPIYKKLAEQQKAQFDELYNKVFQSEDYIRNLGKRNEEDK